MATEGCMASHAALVPLFAAPLKLKTAIFCFAKLDFVLRAMVNSYGATSSDRAPVVMIQHSLVEADAARMVSEHRTRSRCVNNSNLLQGEGGLLGECMQALAQLAEAVNTTPTRPGDKLIGANSRSANE